MDTLIILMCVGVLVVLAKTKWRNSLYINDLRAGARRRRKLVTIKHLRIFSTFPVPHSQLATDQHFTTIF